VRAQNACDRSYLRVFDRIRAECACVKWASTLEQMHVSLNANPCLRSNLQGTVDRTVQGNFFFK
jgi:hypothetical protein